MSTEYFLLFFGLIFPLMFSPGPTNIVLAMSGIKQGFRASIPLIAGLNLVTLISALLIGFGLGELLQLYPNIIFTLQLLGTFYVIYLAYRFIKADNKKKSGNNKTFSFLDGVMVQVLNPKAWFMLFLMFSVLLDGSFNHNTQVIYLVTLYTILSISANFVWVATGKQISRLTSNKQSEEVLNYFFSTALLLVAIWLLLQLLSSH